MMRKFWYAAVFFLFMAPITAWGQQSTCDMQIQTANAMMEELLQQVRVMSVRAAQHYSRVPVLLAKLDEAKNTISKLKLKRETKD